jgi:hypothetical protein
MVKDVLLSDEDAGERKRPESRQREPQMNGRRT